ncbi:MAG: hypothetical protein R3F60_33970 [bacterium]
MRRWLALLAAFGAGCAEPEPLGQDPSQSSSIVLAADEATLFVASPDDDQVVEIDAATLAVRRSVPVAGAPRALAWAGDRLAVARGLAEAVTLLDPATLIATDVPLPCTGAHAVVATATAAFFACRDDLRVVRVDVAAAQVDRVWTLARPPTALAFADGRLWIATGGHLLAQAADAPAGPVRPVVDRDLTPDATHAASPVEALAVGDAPAPIAVLQAVENDGDRDRPPEAGDYGRVHDGEPRLQPWIAGGGCAPRYARFDGGLRRFSGPAAAVWRGGLLYVVHRFTNDFAVLDCTNLDDEGLPRVRASAALGAGPAGLAVSADGQRVWIDVAFDGAVALIDLAGELAPPTVERRPVAALRLSPRALEGRRLFHDATRAPLTPSRVVTCASCHPDGGQDGLRWFIHTPAIPAKLRRTPPAWMARPELLPLHWAGDLPDALTLVQATVRDLMGGTGDVVDLGAIAAYMAELPLPRPRPPLDAAEADCQARGAEVFAASGCGTCHGGPLATDGQSHVIRPAPADPAGLTGPVQTPSLLGVRRRGPWLHDGSAPTLRSLWTDLNGSGQHGQSPEGADLDALICDLERR